MPKIFEYLGIVFFFYSKEHDPIHVHAKFGDAEIKIEFFLKNGRIFKINYLPITGKFSNVKLKELKTFVKTYKYEMLAQWERFFIFHYKAKFKRITKKLK